MYQTRKSEVVGLYACDSHPRRSSPLPASACKIWAESLRPLGFYSLSVAQSSSTSA
jgi:hypothetical protein